MGVYITTDRLILRPMSDAEWTRFIDSVFENDECLFQFGFDKSEELREMLAEPNKERVIYYSFVLQDIGDMVGYVGITPDCNNLEFYVFGEYRRMEYASEAVIAFMDACKEGVITGHKIRSFIAEVVSDNTACIAFLKKLGFQKNGMGFNITTGYSFLGFDYAA